MLLPSLLLFAAQTRPEASSPVPAVRYTVRYAGTERDHDWHVRVEGRGLASGTGPLSVHLEDWGEWTEVDDYHLRNLSSVPPIARREGSRCDWILDPPSGWDGSLFIEYDVATLELGSTARAKHGLVPYRAPTYTFGYSTNTLAMIDQQGWTAKPRCTFRIEAPEGWTVATGLAGVSGNVQEGSFPESYDNGVISMGRPVAVALREDSKLPIEVVQWGGPPGPALPVRDFARAYVAQCIAATGTPPRQPIRLLITEPHSGGTRSDGSIAIGCPDLASGGMKAGTLHFVAHELFHDWLGGQLRPVDGSERLAWFWEAFTDYLSLWILVRAGLVEPAKFAARMQDYEETIAGNEHRKTAAYADPQVNWRDPAIEPLAYKGSALLAFSLDVALRRAGRPGLLELIRVLLARPGGRYDLDALKVWVVDQGLERFWNERVAAPGAHELAADLEFAGFERTGTSWKPVEGRTESFFH